MKNVIAAALLTTAFAVPALAQPPRDAMPLSQIIASIEAEEGFAYIDDIDWDSDGYWEIEYYRTDGAKVEIDIDPVTGESVR